MAEYNYVDRDSIVRGLRMAHDYEGADFVASFPASEVVEVVHAHKVTHNRPITEKWLTGETENGEQVTIKAHGLIAVNPVDYCSACGKRLDDTFQNYCPACGAKIDERSEDE